MNANRIAEMERRLRIADILHAARLRSPYAGNLSAAARAANISPSYLHKVEAGVVTLAPATLAAVCRVLDMPLADIREYVPELDRMAGALREWGWTVNEPPESNL